MSPESASGWSSSSHRQRSSRETSGGVVWGVSVAAAEQALAADGTAGSWFWALEAQCSKPALRPAVRFLPVGIGLSVGFGIGSSAPLRLRRRPPPARSLLPDADLGLRPQLKGIVLDELRQDIRVV